LLRSALNDRKTVHLTARRASANDVNFKQRRTILDMHRALD
jgi:hypothetical protein